jgi:ABC-2 type transport system ATP-binding protein
MDQPVISCQKVSKTFKTDVGRKPTLALQDLSFDVKKGEVLGIIGPNGAGKSTSLKLLMGFVRPDQGNLLLNGLSPLNPQSHKRLGYLPEHPCLYRHLSIYDHLCFAAKINKIPAREVNKRILGLLERVNLLESIKLPIRRFSKGMTQRGALAYALLHEPDLLILDEPMSGLDPVGRQLVLDLMREYKAKGTTILFCSHILTDIERVCSRIAVMHHGHIAATISPEELTNSAYAQKDSLQSPLESFFFQTIQSKTGGI